MSIVFLSVLVVLAPLLGAMLSGLFRNQIGRSGAHTITIAMMGIACGLSCYIAYVILQQPQLSIDSDLYTWASGNELFPFSFHIGFKIDALSTVMMVIVTFVSLLVHIYSIGYMSDDDGYQRFFSYISLFTFMMLMLVTSNNFMQMFFGWEGVGLVSYLLIGFWYKKESANQGSLKAFLVNRVGDFGFILGLSLIYMYTGSLHFETVFHSVGTLNKAQMVIFNGHEWSVLTVICLLLFVGAMGKSAQVPLHVWLPESMEGPTPISALIHAATMVTAGVFMVARISPMTEYSTVALSCILVIGATGALFTGILALVMNDIKRVIAYSTLSQLGYMMVAMGASAYSAGIFHLLTHACFKALLFLAAGSVILGMHHEQDMRKMGGLWRKMPVTYVTFLIGSLALCAIPPFSGFYSKDTIIEVAKISSIPGSRYAYLCVLIGAFVTAMYTFRSFFMTFHGKPRMSQSEYGHVHESSCVVWIPLVLLAIPSIIIGYVLYMPMLFNHPLLSDSIVTLPVHDTLSVLGKEITSPFESATESLHSTVLWLTLIGAAIAWISYIWLTWLPGKIAVMFSGIYLVLTNKYGFDSFNNWFFINGTKRIGNIFYQVMDRMLIDQTLVNGSGNFVKWFASRSRMIQNGNMYRYIAVMIFGLLGFWLWLLWN